MIVSLVINNHRGEVLISSESKNGLWTFPNFEMDIKLDSTMPNIELVKKLKEYVINDKDFVNRVKNFCKTDLDIEVEVKSFIEAYYILQVQNLIITVNILFGNPTKIKYRQIKWAKLCSCKMEDFTNLGQKVLDKIQTCEYCKYIHGESETLNDFLNNMLEKIEEVNSVIEELLKRKNKTIWKIGIRDLLVHIRSFYIENKNLTKNITIQNYLRMHKKEHLAECFDEILKVKTEENFTIREIIKESVDKHIAHYDVPTKESTDLYNFALKIFNIDGVLPIVELVLALISLVENCCYEVWYYSGKLGVSMDRLSPDFSDYFAQERNHIVNSIKLKFE